MTNPKGTKLETATVNWLREHGWPWSRRIVKEGARDKGDVALGDGIPVTIECKNEKSIEHRRRASASWPTRWRTPATSGASPSTRSEGPPTSVSTTPCSRSL